MTRFWIICGGSIACLLYLLWSVWPLKNFISLSQYQSRTLIVLTNENEARPCGGFITAYAYLQPSQRTFDFKNSYHLSEYTIGKAQFPLNTITPEVKFWDLGSTPDMADCQNQLKQNYTQATQKPVDQVWLLNLQTLTDILEILGPVNLEDDQINHQNLFAWLSRQVSNIDRHDETTLKNRKTVLPELARKILVKAVLSPHKWPQLSRQIRHNIDNNQFVVPNLSPDTIDYQPQTLSFVEWNLGGAKSSRYLQKNVFVTARQNKNQTWNVLIKLNVYHSGSYDEPLSQDWRGGFTVQLPSQWTHETRWLSPKSIKPGQSFAWSENFTVEKLNDLAIIAPRAQQWAYDIQVTSLPQQNITSLDLSTKENTGHWQGILNGAQKKIQWQITPDQIPPFLTLHQPIDPNTLPSDIALQFIKSPLVVEIHFNEAIKLQPKFKAQLIDRNYTNQKTENPVYQNHKLLTDERTLILGFSQSQKQTDERYYLQLKGLTDYSGNLMSTKSQSTVITR